MEGTSGREESRDAEQRKLKMEELKVLKKEICRNGSSSDIGTTSSIEDLILQFEKMNINDATRPKPRAQPRSVKKFMGFTNIQIQRFIKAYSKFGVPLERLDSIAKDAKLTDKSVADLKALAELLHNTCISTMEEYEQHLKNKTTEGKGSGKQQGPFIRISGVSVNAKAILQYEEELAVLHAAIPADPEERKKFHLPRRVKTAHFDVDWDVEDDASLLLGVYKYGYRNWNLIKSDQELNLGAKILPVEPAKTPQGKQLKARVVYLIRILRKGNANCHSGSELKKREPFAGKDKETPKRQEECGKGLSSQENAKKPSEEAMVKSERKKREPDAGKANETPKRQEERGKGLSSQQNAKKPSEEAVVKLKVKQVQGAVEVAPGSQPIHTGELNEETFNICKEKMRPVEDTLKQLGEPDKSLSMQEKVEFTRTCLLKVGDCISDCLDAYSEQKLIEEWRRNLWIYVSLFSEFDGRKLRKIYKKAEKKRSKQEDPKGQAEAKANREKKRLQGTKNSTPVSKFVFIKKLGEEAFSTWEGEGEAEADEEWKQLLGPMNSTIRNQPVLRRDLNQATHSIDQKKKEDATGEKKLVQQEAPSHQAPIAGLPRGNCTHENKSLFNKPDRYKWPRDCKFTYSSKASHMCDGQRHHPYQQPQWYKDSRMRQKPHRNSGNNPVNNMSRKRPFNSDQDYQGRRDAYERYHDAKRRRSEDIPKRLGFRKYRRAW